MNKFTNFLVYSLLTVALSLIFIIGAIEFYIKVGLINQMLGG